MVRGDDHCNSVLHRVRSTTTSYYVVVQAETRWVTVGFSRVLRQPPHGEGVQGEHLSQDRELAVGGNRHQDAGNSLHLDQAIKAKSRSRRPITAEQPRLRATGACRSFPSSLALLEGRRLHKDDNSGAGVSDRPSWPRCDFRPTCSRRCRCCRCCRRRCCRQRRAPSASRKRPSRSRAAHRLRNPSRSPCSCTTWSTTGSPSRW